MQHALGDGQNGFARLGDGRDAFASSLICLLMPGCEVYSALAASEIFRPCRTISLRNRSCCKFMPISI
jgi:hypothetical protein